MSTTRRLWKIHLHVCAVYQRIYIYCLIANFPLNLCLISNKQGLRDSLNLTFESDMHEYRHLEGRRHTKTSLALNLSGERRRCATLFFFP